MRPLTEKPEDHPECEEAARRVYSMPGIKVLSGAQRELHYREEMSGEPKPGKKTRTEGPPPPPRPQKGTGHPWRISH